MLISGGTLFNSHYVVRRTLLNKEYLIWCDTPHLLIMRLALAQDR
jgi:hypothetical protein